MHVEGCCCCFCGRASADHQEQEQQEEEEEEEEFVHGRGCEDMSSLGAWGVHNSSSRRGRGWCEAEPCRYCQNSSCSSSSSSSHGHSCSKYLWEELAATATATAAAADAGSMSDSSSSSSLSVVSLQELVQMQASRDPLSALSTITALQSLVVTGDQPLPPAVAQQLTRLTRLRSLEVMAGSTSKGAIPLGGWGLEGFAGGGVGVLGLKGLGWSQETPADMAVAVGQLPCLTKLVVVEVPGQSLDWVKLVSGKGWVGMENRK